MTVPEVDIEGVRAFLSALGCDDIDAEPNKRGWLNASCPWAPIERASGGYYHTGGTDSDPSFGVYLKPDPEEASSDPPKLPWSCWACGQSGIGLSWLLCELRRESGRAYDAAGDALDRLGRDRSSHTLDGVPIARMVDRDAEAPDAQRADQSSSIEAPESGETLFDDDTDHGWDGGLVDRRDVLGDDALAHAPPGLHPYLEGRGFEPETARAWDLRIERDARTGYKRPVFPVRNLDGDLLAYTRRVPWDRPKCQVCKYDGPDEALKQYDPEAYRERQPSFGGSCPKCSNGWVWPKYQHSEGFQRNLYLYGEHLVDRERSTGVLVEGTTDAPWLWQQGVANVVATMGSKPGTAPPGDGRAGEQLWRAGELFDRIVALADGDAAGRAWADEIEAQFAGREWRAWVDIRVCPEGRDPGDLSGDEVRDLLGDAAPWRVPF